MASAKVTFTLDRETLAKLDLTAKRLRKPKSQVVREAIADYHRRSDRLSDTERDRLLAAIDHFAGLPPTRSQAQVEAELKELRAVRRLPGRWHPVD